MQDYRGTERPRKEDSFTRSCCPRLLCTELSSDKHRLRFEQSRTAEKVKDYKLQDKEFLNFDQTFTSRISKLTWSHTNVLGMSMFTIDNNIKIAMLRLRTSGTQKPLGMLYPTPTTITGACSDHSISLHEVVNVSSKIIQRLVIYTRV